MKKTALYLLLSTAISTNTYAACIQNANDGIECTEDTAGAGINYTNNANISPASGNGINITNTSGDIIIINNGNIFTEGGAGIASNSANTGSFSIINKGNITVTNNRAISTDYNSNHSNVTYNISGNITQNLVGNTPSTIHAILAHNIVNPSSTAHVTIADNSIIKVIGRDTSNNLLFNYGIGVVVQSSIESSLIIGKNVTIDTTDGGGDAIGLHTNSAGGKTYLEIGEGSLIYSAVKNNGAGNAITYSSTNGGTGKYVNRGTIDSTTGNAISQHNGDGTGSLSVYNMATGTINGGISSTTINPNTNLYNYGTWNVMDFDDTLVHEGTRDTLNFHKNIFARGEIENYGIISLVNPEFYGLTPDRIISTGQYLVNGNSVHNMNNGAMQAFFSDLYTFHNAGIIDMQYNSHAGDVLTISSSSTAGSSGTSNYISNGGSLLIDTVLNEGGANSASDVLVVDNTQLDSSATKIIVKNSGGTGAETISDGIKVVEVLGTASDAGSFVLGTPVTAGLYEYTLHQGDTTGVDALSWFLRSFPANINPKVGAYLRTQTAMNDIFMHGLYDRIGRYSFIDPCSSSYDKYGAWIRAEYHKSEGDIASNAKGKKEIKLTHLGSDIYRKDLDNNSELRVGLMAGYAQLETESKSTTTGSKSKGESDVYSVGTYATIFNGPLYFDTWAQYAWANNKAWLSGDNRRDKYDSSNITLSLEVGYGIKIYEDSYYHYVFEPQAQTAYVYNDMDRHVSKSDGLIVDNSDNDGFITRLGGRFYVKDKSTRTFTLEPYAEANWYHSFTNQKLDFNGVTYKDGEAKDKYELKLGLQSSINKTYQIWGDIGYKVGKSNYDDYSFTLGAKYLW